MRILSTLLALFCLFSSRLSFAIESLVTEQTVIAVVVANDQATKMLSLPELKLIYWRKKNYWANGKRMHPVNLPTDNPLRMQFSKKILGSLPSTQIDYWNGLYFHGKSPPHVVNSEEAVIRFVTETSGAVGYIEACNLDTRVQAIAWVAENGDVLNKAPDYRCVP